MITCNRLYQILLLHSNKDTAQEEGRVVRLGEDMVVQLGEDMVVQLEEDMTGQLAEDIVVQLEEDRTVQPEEDRVVQLEEDMRVVVAGSAVPAGIDTAVLVPAGTTSTVGEACDLEGTGSIEAEGEERFAGSVVEEVVVAEDVERGLEHGTLECLAAPFDLHDNSLCLLSSFWT